MTDQDISVRYHRVAIFLHWVIALAIIAMLAVGLVMEDISPLSLRIEVYQLHKSLGLTILALSLVRLFWRLTHKAPPLPAAMPAWEKFGARTAHVILYIVMIGMPMSGWAIISTSSTKFPTHYFGTFLVPLLPLDKALHDVAESAHALLAYGAIGLISLHVLAALKHHFITHDDVLTRMLPRFRRTA